MVAISSEPVQTSLRPLGWQISFISCDTLTYTTRDSWRIRNLQHHWLRWSGREQGELGPSVRPWDKDLQQLFDDDCPQRVSSKLGPKHHHSHARSLPPHLSSSRVSLTSENLPYKLPFTTRARALGGSLSWLYKLLSHQAAFNDLTPEESDPK